jgi:hypothetical protein
MNVGKDGVVVACGGVGGSGGVFVKLGVVHGQWSIVHGGWQVVGSELVSAAGAVGPGAGGGDGDGVARAGGHGWRLSCVGEGCPLHDWGVVAQQAVDEHSRRRREC